ncbi:MAG: histidine kinase, partial [Spirosoma sp.]|nr:histidine kinase [Spirosoma sp.]
MLKSFDIYNQNNVLKIIVVLNLLLVGTGSLLYTDNLINKLETREEQYVQLYAKSIAYLTSNPAGTGDLTFVTNEILEANKTIPAIYVDNNNELANYKNIDFPEGITDAGMKQLLRQKITEMKQRHPAVVVDLGNGERGLVYYSNSTLL